MQFDARKQGPYILHWKNCRKVWQTLRKQLQYIAYQSISAVIFHMNLFRDEITWVQNQITEIV